jgi:hypothetical protein
VIGVAIISALLGFALASQLQRLTSGAKAPARPAASQPARIEPQPSETSPTPSARVEEPQNTEPAAPQATVPDTKAAASPPAPPTPAPTPIEAPAAPPPAPQPVVAERKPPARPVPRIEVSINATPWAVIEVDGRELGETPLGGVALERGTHRFVARFPNGRVVERSVEIDASHRALVFE